MTLYEVIYAVVISLLISALTVVIIRWAQSVDISAFALKYCIGNGLILDILFIFNKVLKTKICSQYNILSQKFSMTIKSSIISLLVIAALDTFVIAISFYLVDKSIDNEYKKRAENNN